VNNKEFAKIAVQYAINLSGKAPPISVFWSICPVWLLLYDVQVTRRNISCQVSWIFFFVGLREPVSVVWTLDVNVTACK